MPTTDLSYTAAKSLLDYDQNTGLLRWRKRMSNRVKVGSIAGTDKGNGYFMVMINKRLHLAHRLAWLLHYGKWPAANIDHIDGNGKNNRIANLRECSQSQNNANWKALKVNNTSGFRGVYAVPNGKWIAQIKIDGATRHLGTFKNKRDASAAYDAVAIQHFGAFYAPVAH